MRNLFPFLIALAFPLAHAADSALAAVAQLSIPDDQRDAFQKMIDDGDITRIFAEHGGIDHFSIDETGVKGEQQQLVRVAVHTKDGNSAPFGDILIIRTADRGWLVDSRSF